MDVYICIYLQNLNVQNIYVLNICIYMWCMYIYLHIKIFANYLAVHTYGPGSSGGATQRLPVTAQQPHNKHI